MSDMQEKQVITKIGLPFNIRLWEDRTRGSRWIVSYDPAVFKLVNDEYERTRHIRTDDIGMRCFELVGTDMGVFKIHCELRYGWKFSAEQHLTYVVDVGEVSLLSNNACASP